VLIFERVLLLGSNSGQDTTLDNRVRRTNLDCITRRNRKQPEKRRLAASGGAGQRFPRQNPQRCGRWLESPAAVFWASSAMNSSPFGSGLEATDWGAGAARRGSLRCRSIVSTGVGAGFFSAGSVAFARAEREFTVTFWGWAAGAGCALLATGGAAGTGTETGAAATGAAGVAATGAGAGGREGADGVAAT
jgi:hypothetical protein